MRERTYLRTALLLPLALPVLALTPVGRLLPVATALLVGSLIVAGVPYVVYAAGLLWWSAGKPAAVVRRRWHTTPPVFGLLVALQALFAPARDAGGLTPSASGEALLWGAIAAGFALGYVLLAEAGRALLLRLGVLVPDPEDAQDHAG